MSTEKFPFWKYFFIFYFLNEKYDLDVKKNLPYQYFLCALNAWISKKQDAKEPYQKQLAISLDVGEPTISKYLKNRTQKIIPFKSQVAIAEHISGDYISFLEKGKTIYEISNPLKLTVSKHRDLVGNFLDQERGLRINSKLIQAERLNPKTLDNIEGYIDSKLEELKQKKTPKTGTDHE